MTHAAAGFAVSTHSRRQEFSARDALVELAERDCTEFERMIFPGHIWSDALEMSASRELRRFNETLPLRVPPLTIANNDLCGASPSPPLFGVFATALGVNPKHRASHPPEPIR